MRSPEETKLNFLVGSWSSSDRTFPGPGGPGGTSQGTATYAWELGGKWLNYRFRTLLPGLGGYEVHGGIAFENETSQYRAYAINNLGNLLVYDGSWETDQRLVFTLVYPQPQGDTRVSYTKDPSGSVRMTSERPRKEGGRETYFETVLSRADSRDT
jgi:hypothetical protein